MSGKSLNYWVPVALVWLVGCNGAGGLAGGSVSKETLGRALFFDGTLSEPQGQSCASCHQPGSFFADPRPDFPTSEGARKGLFGSRQTPTLNYMAFSPDFNFNPFLQDYIGGQFWDGRAANFEDQVHFPMLSSFEMNNATKAQIVDKVSIGAEAEMMRQVYGQDIFGDVDKAFDAIADAIAAYERGPDFRAFTSKFDYYRQGVVRLSYAEQHGFELFNGKGGCSEACHLSQTIPGVGPAMFTNFTYENLGVPKNLSNPFYYMPDFVNPDGANFVDAGLMAVTGRPEDRGRFKTPTLRNIAMTAPYMHNGVFKTLEEVLRFYNERDLGHFPPPEVPETINQTELGDLRLTDAEISDIIAFLRTLTDGYTPPPR